MSEELEKLKALLWERWDPIGVNAPGWPRDEYDSYAMRIFSMLHDGAGSEAIAEYLSRSQTKHMGLNWSDIHDPIAVEAIRIHEEAKS